MKNMDERVGNIKLEPGNYIITKKIMKLKS